MDTLQYKTKFNEMIKELKELNNCYKKYGDEYIKTDFLIDYIITDYLV